jgi:hypothetical protein
MVPELCSFQYMCVNEPVATDPHISCFQQSAKETFTLTLRSTDDFFHPFKRVVNSTVNIKTIHKQILFSID